MVWDGSGLASAGSRRFSLGICDMGILAVVHALTRRGSCRGYCGGPALTMAARMCMGNRALDILKERYAKGEYLKRILIE